MNNFKYYEQCECQDDCESISFFTSVAIDKISHELCYNRNQPLEKRHELFRSYWNATKADIAPDIFTSYVGPMHMNYGNYSDEFRNLDPVCLDHIANDLAVVHITMSPKTMIKNVRKPITTSFLFFSHIGGLLGIFGGITIITFFEFLFWIGQCMQELYFFLLFIGRRY